MSIVKAGKTRRLVDETFTAVSGSSTTQPISTSTWHVRDLQATISFSNPAWLAYKRTGHRRRGQMDLGNNFFTVKHSFDPGAVFVDANNGTLPTNPTHRFIKGYWLPFAAVVTGGFEVPLNEYTDLQGRLVLPARTTALDPYGATAISRCSPTKPHADVAVSLAEVAREGLPSLASQAFKSRGTGRITGVASDHLGVQFGVLPLVSEVKDVVSAVRDSGKILDQYARDSGRAVRRSYRFQTETTTTTVALSSSYPWPNPSIWSVGNAGTQTRLTTTKVDRWFVGSFVYHRAGGDNKWSKIAQRYQDLNHVLGTGVGPSTLWNLMPWSWAVDWFTNVGDVMSNIQMFMNDGLIMEYGYVMETVETSTEYVRMNALPVLWADPTRKRFPPTWSCSKTVISKERRQANPFGFGVTNSSLSAKQWSIATALGITRASRIS